ncbi:MAG: hydantoinase B/oxoprolinase family protein [Alphaproteobacteria bacterium]|nr:hydantoinase B/oxoprolinase family protein [Alphaproteobacteria bacterium]
MSAIDPISLGIQWDRLISIADEIINTLVRTSFSTNVRESYDLSCVLFDHRGRSLAQGSYSVPSFTGTAPETLAHMLRRFPPETLAPGDVVMTNDPWIGTGHLFDINVMQPVFRRGTLVGYAMSITHLPDIGGAGFSAMAREVYEEGLRFPVCKLATAGKVDPFVIELVETNVRVPEQTVGDLMANVSCTTVGGRMLVEFMDEYGIDSLEPLADAIMDFSDRALRDELAKIRPGTYRNRIQVEGHDRPLTLACAVTVAGSSVKVDFAGTGPAIPAAINVPLCYTRAMTCYAIKTLTTPRIPNNDGSLRPIAVAAAENCILNPLPPFPTGGRHIVGHFVVPLIFGALAEALPARVQADSGMLNLINVQGRTREGRGVSSIFFASGGFGALRGIDGAPCTPSPSNMTGTPVEVWENLTGTTIERKELLADSGGPGEFRGGLGQQITICNDGDRPMTISCLAGRTEFAPAGVLGGKPGRLREIKINGATVHPKGRYALAPGDRVEMLEAGGGGYGDPGARCRSAVAADIAEGAVTREAAIRDYGWHDSS